MPGDGAAAEASDPQPSGTGAGRESCVKYFDALWFCYSPVHQLQQYYRFGHADDCTGHWSELYRCLKQRTKFAEQTVEETGHPLWRLRTPEEAAEAWERTFGDSREGHSTPAGGQAAPGDGRTQEGRVV